MPPSAPAWRGQSRIPGGRQSMYVEPWPGYEAVHGPPQASRATDPETSREAEEAHTASGLRGRLTRILLMALCEKPGQTRDELTRATGLSAYEASKRLSHLTAGGYLTKGTPRKGSVSGHSQHTWWPTTWGRRYVG